MRWAYASMMVMMMLPIVVMGILVMEVMVMTVMVMTVMVMVVVVVVMMIMMIFDDGDDTEMVPRIRPHLEHVHARLVAHHEDGGLHREWQVAFFGKPPQLLRTQPPPRGQEGVISTTTTATVPTLLRLPSRLPLRHICRTPAVAS